jgi:hypothetical protein
MLTMSQKTAALEGEEGAAELENVRPKHTPRAVAHQKKKAEEAEKKKVGRGG